MNGVQQGWVDKTIEQRKELVGSLFDTLEKILKEDIWEKVESDDPEVENEFFTFFTDRELNLQYVIIDFKDYLEEIVEFIDEPQNRKDLIDTIILDKYYKRMIYIS